MVSTTSMDSTSTDAGSADMGSTDTSSTDEESTDGESTDSSNRQSKTTPIRVNRATALSGERDEAKSISKCQGTRNLDEASPFDVSRDLGLPLDAIVSFRAANASIPPSQLTSLASHLHPANTRLAAGYSTASFRQHPYLRLRRSQGNTRCAHTRTISLSSQSGKPISSLLTPASSVCSTPSSVSSPAPQAARNGSSSAKASRTSSLTVTPSALKLVQLAVELLAENWPRASEPAVFREPTFRHYTSSPTLVAKPLVHQPTPRSPVAPELLPTSIEPQVVAFLGHQLRKEVFAAEPDVLSLKAFICHVLRYSKSTCSVLSSALCYIVAIKFKLAQLVGLERGNQGRGITGVVKEEESSQTLRSYDEAPPLNPAPFSLLLCPRRAFVAALVIATKCLQDRCFSNRVWAKICGLPAREISLCERTLCEALEWRLWVGKGHSVTGSREQSTRIPVLDLPASI